MKENMPKKNTPRRDASMDFLAMILNGADGIFASLIGICVSVFICESPCRWACLILGLVGLVFSVVCIYYGREQFRYHKAKIFKMSDMLYVKAGHCFCLSLVFSAVLPGIIVLLSLFQ